MQKIIIDLRNSHFELKCSSPGSTLNHPCFHLLILVCALCLLRRSGPWQKCTLPSGSASGCSAMSLAANRGVSSSPTLGICRSLPTLADICVKFKCSIVHNGNYLVFSSFCMQLALHAAGQGFISNVRLISAYVIPTRIWMQLQTFTRGPGYFDPAADDAMTLLRQEEGSITRSSLDERNYRLIIKFLTLY